MREVKDDGRPGARADADGHSRKNSSMAVKAETQPAVDISSGRQRDAPASSLTRFLTRPRWACGGRRPVR